MTTADRASVAATAVLQIIGQALRTDPALRAALAELLADEIDAAVRQAITEIRREDG
jgi:hypothetical protein